jgi:hypothetical protein
MGLMVMDEEILFGNVGNHQNIFFAQGFSKNSPFKF